MHCHYLSPIVIVIVTLLSGQGDDENALVDNEEAQAEEVLH